MLMPHSQLPCFSWNNLRNSCAAALIATALSCVPLTGQGSPAAGKSKAPVAAGEPLSTRVIQDTAQRVPFGLMVAPASWRFDGRLDWNYAHVELPVIFSFHTENPANEEAVFGYPMEAYYELNPPDRYTPIGQNGLGYTHMPPMQPLQMLVRFIQRARGNVPGLKFEGYKELPGLPKAMKADQIKQDRPPTGLGIKVSYSLNGKPVEEEFYAVSLINTVPSDGPQGRTYQIYWGTSALFSFRAPAGTLDKRRPVFAAIAKSFRPNPAWQARYQAVQKVLNDQFNRNLQQGYAQIAAAAALSKQISANNDAMLANIDRQLAQSRTTSAPGGGRSSADKFDDYIRGVDTLDDPYYGTTQLSNQNQFHWTDGFGSYRSTNDASYNPNQTEIGNWTPMTPTR
jgi:hypothetical protein